MGLFAVFFVPNMFFRQCRKITTFLAEGYAVSVTLVFAPPIPYDAKVLKQRVVWMFGFDD
jgi:hypothetical protein